MMHFSNFANGAGQIKVDEWVKLAKQYNVAVHERCRSRHTSGFASLGLHQHGIRPGHFQRRQGNAGPTMRRHADRPQGSGGYALLNNSPHEDTIGRSQKVGKEEIIGMVKAVELFLNEDHDGLSQRVAGASGRNFARIDKNSRE